MKEWLDQSVEGHAYPFVVATYVEKVGWAGAGAAREMARLLGESTASPEFIERVSSRRGWDKGRARATFVAEMQPGNDAVKKGKFGEVLHGAVLEEFCGMVVVYHRYRYNPNPDTSPPGLDTIALMPRDGGDERLVYSETKLRTGADGGTLAKALGQLTRTASAGHPPSLKALLQALSDTDSPLFDRVMQVADNRVTPPHYRIGVIFEAKHWSDSYLRMIKDNHGAQRMDLAVDVVKIASLGSLINDAYSSVGR